MRRIGVGVVGFTLAGLLGVVFATPSAAAEIVVDAGAPQGVADGQCSLSEAVEAANTNAAVDGCDAGEAGQDTITLPAETISLAVTLDVAEPLTVRGAGMGVTTIDRGDANAFNVANGVDGYTANFEDLSFVGRVNASSSRSLVFLRVSLTGTTGNAINTSDGDISLTDSALTGGARMNTSGGSISLTDSAISDPSGPGINSSTGPISLLRSEITDSGGQGINTSSGEVTLTESTISGSDNRGINSSRGTLVLRRSTISGSTNDGMTAAFGGSITVENSTISGNGGSAVDASSEGVTVVVEASTLVGNGAGIDLGDSVATVRNSIIADNTTDCSTAIVSQGHNIDSDGSCGLAAAGDQPSVDPLLGPLAGNGGPTLTHLPQGASPAIDAGDDAACLDVDQRGVSRPQDGDDDGTTACDVGAVEVAGTPTPEPEDTTPTPEPEETPRAEPVEAQPAFTG